MLDRRAASLERDRLDRAQWSQRHRAVGLSPKKLIRHINIRRFGDEATLRLRLGGPNIVESTPSLNCVVRCIITLVTSIASINRNVNCPPPAVGCYVCVRNVSMLIRQMSIGGSKTV